METLATSHPKRSLDRHVKVFEDTGYFHIDELKHLLVQALTSEPYGFLPGTAWFLLAEVDKKVRAVDRAVDRTRRKAKKARRSEI